MSGVVCDLGVAARAIHKGKILLVKEARGNYQNLWGLPKGSVDEGESPESAVLRELSEETGVSGTIIGLSAVRSTLYKRKPAVFLCYDVSIESNQTSISTDEIDEIKWVDLEELKTLDWVSQTMHNLALDGLSGKRMSLKSSRPITKSDTYHVYSVNSQSKNVG